LREIFSSDFQPFIELRALSLWNNQLQYLEPDLFAFNPKLEVLKLGSNKIKHIAHGAFTNIPLLSALDLGTNICISEDAKTKDDVLKLISSLEEKCFNQNIAMTILTRSMKKCEINFY
jgi:Leucine-rich repeat (LRR) protein